MKRASIDLGTNTCLLLVADCEKGSQAGFSKANPTSFWVKQVLRDETTVVRLGEGVDQSRLLQPEPIKRVLKCLERYSQIVRDLGIEPNQVSCVATSQARDAANSGEFFDRVKKATGFAFEVVSGEEEGRLTFLGAMSGIAGKRDGKSKVDQAVVIDIGGGSTELISFTGGVSLDVGSVRFHERYLKSNPVTDDEFWACQDAIDEEVEKCKRFRSSLSNSSQWVAVAGTATTLAAWYLNIPKFDAEQVEGTVLTRGDVHRLVEELKWRTVEERCQLPCMEPMRADVILAGALILWRVMEILGVQECQVSTRGLRYGLLVR